MHRSTIFNHKQTINIHQNTFLIYKYSIAYGCSLELAGTIYIYNALLGGLFKYPHHITNKTY